MRPKILPKEYAEKFLGDLTNLISLSAEWHAKNTAGPSETVMSIWASLDRGKYAESSVELSLQQSATAVFDAGVDENRRITRYRPALGKLIFRHCTEMGGESCSFIMGASPGKCFQISRKFFLLTAVCHYVLTIWSQSMQRG